MACNSQGRRQKSMTQDTRKDRRVKIVSLNVRYKSATVDEFIENHAHDVSRGGIYIKTANPFPPGTLLKFEIRLASDQAVIAGVGRVVWKRDAGQANGERPAGMGVKFIKIDEPSKGVIDRLATTKADAGKAYEAEVETTGATGGDSAPPAAAAAAAATPEIHTAAGGPPRPGLTPAGGFVAGPRKATMMGLGTVSGSSAPPPPADKTSSPPKEAAAKAAGGMFPATQSEADMPPKQEQTVMKQAAELLEEALREAGGSMDDVGHNPLFSGGDAKLADGKAEAKAEPAPVEPKAEAKKASVPPAGDAAKDDDAAKARAMVAEMSPAPRKTTSEPPRTTRDSPGAKRSTPPSAAADAPKKGSGSFVAVFLAVVVVAGVVVMFRDKLFGTGDTPAPTPTVTATASAAPPVVSAAPSATASAAASASAAPSASAAASAAPSASAATTAAATTAATTATAAPTGRPVPTGAAVATSTATATAAAPTATATAAPTATATAVATAPTATAAPKPTATATATAKPKPKPADDNPY